jgi:hypothetical protein
LGRPSRLGPRLHSTCTPLPLQVEKALESRIRRRATEAIEVYEASYTKKATLSVGGGGGGGAQSGEPPPPCVLTPKGAPIRRDLASLPPLSLPPKTALPRGVPLAAAVAAATSAPLSAGPVSLDAAAIDAARERGAQVSLHLPTSPYISLYLPISPARERGAQARPLHP